jgi:hypothetical protein
MDPVYAAIIGGLTTYVVVGFWQLERGLKQAECRRVQEERDRRLDAIHTAPEVTHEEEAHH